MKQLFIAGNWKSNKTIAEATEWLQSFKALIGESALNGVKVVIAAPYTVLPVAKYHIGAMGLPIELAAQNISPFESGAYTGEISGSMLVELVSWVIIGHSERRKHFGETDEVLFKKVEKAKAAGLSVIYCVQDTEIAVPPNVDVIGYEPYFAIGTGKTDSPENAEKVIAAIKAKAKVKTVIYGGSVTPENVATFVSQPSIDGVLPGGASLVSETFVSLIRSALGSGSNT